MENFELDFQQYSMPIPKIFHSVEHGGVFKYCSVCKIYLLDDEISYFIEKAFRGTEAVFEYAMCSNCRDSMETEVSMESMMNIGNYFLEHVNISYRKELMETFDNNIKPWLNECIFTGNQMNECQDYQICAECQGANIMISFFPLMISSQAVEEIQQLMSKKTKENFDRFVRDTLNPPVDFKDIPMLV